MALLVVVLFRLHWQLSEEDAVRRWGDGYETGLHPIDRSQMLFVPLTKLLNQPNGQNLTMPHSDLPTSLNRIAGGFANEVKQQLGRSLKHLIKNWSRCIGATTQST
ncbi:MAG: hypothetical protein KME16_25165 [Scytolyngbya sp. HA4215-MV1]|jgi:hypothetical protein|nr:hypothetical protein [Scytolyngbya sp. HA4215-MV1]